MRGVPKLWSTVLTGYRNMKHLISERQCFSQNGARRAHRSACSRVKHLHSFSCKHCEVLKRSQTGLCLKVAASASPDREDALLLSYYASQNKSLFAAQCFVEAVLDSYTRGEYVDELQTALQLKNMQQNGELLNPQDQDLLLSWIIMIMLTAKEVGVAQQNNQQQMSQQGIEQQQQQLPDPSIVSQQYSSQVLGLLQFVKQAEKLYFEEEYTIQKLQSLQAAVSSDPSQGHSQFLEMMQQYTRLVIITLEVVASSGLPTQRQLSNPTSIDAPSGYTAAGVHSSSSVSGNSSKLGLITSRAIEQQRAGHRALAVRLLVTFVGAVIGAPLAMRSFITYALEAYESGIPVPELHQQLQPSEFLQSGGLVPAMPRPEVQQEVNQQLFGRWLSIVYMAAAQLNAVFPAASDTPGWAWYAGEDEVQANAMANFVANTIVRLQTDAAAAAGALDEDKPQEDPLALRIKSQPDAAARLEQTSKLLQQEYQEQGTLRGKDVPLMVRVPDPELETTSGAVLVWKQQVQLVEAVYSYMQALQASV